mgnify:CR=1 FL=1
MNRLILIVVAWLLACSSSMAQLRIEIREGVEKAVPVAVVPFGWDAPGATAISLRVNWKRLDFRKICSIWP